MFRQLGVKDNLAHVQKVYQFVVIDDEMVQEKANHQWPHMKDEMKLGWAIRNGNNSLWIEVLKGKYTKRWSVNMNLEAKTYDSPLWKVIVKFWLAIENKQWWMVGNGNFMFGVISGLMKILD